MPAEASETHALGSEADSSVSGSGCHQFARSTSLAGMFHQNSSKLVISPKAKAKFYGNSPLVWSCCMPFLRIPLRLRDPATAELRPGIFRWATIRPGPGVRHQCNPRCNPYDLAQLRPQDAAGLDFLCHQLHVPRWSAAYVFSFSEGRERVPQNSILKVDLAGLCEAMLLPKGTLEKRRYGPHK